LVHDGPKLIAPILLLGQSYSEKLFSIIFGEISRNRIPHQIEPIYRHFINKNNLPFTGDRSIPAFFSKISSAKINLKIKIKNLIIVSFCDEMNPNF